MVIYIIGLFNLQYNFILQLEYNLRKFLIFNEFDSIIVKKELIGVQLPGTATELDKYCQNEPYIKDKDKGHVNKEHYKY